MKTRKLASNPNPRLIKPKLMPRQIRSGLLMNQERNRLQQVACALFA
jgi:hypothetical protein